MDYSSKIGHYLLYPLAVLAMSAVFFYLGYRSGRKSEKKRIDLFSNPDLPEKK